MTYRVIPTSDAEAAFEAAQQAVRAGEVIVLPTDTVYGVAADATSGAAVQRLLDAKERGRDMPPPVLVAEVAMVRALAHGVDDRLQGLADAFWPGALTVVLRARDTLRMDLGDRGDTVAVRVPDHDFTRELLRRTGPLAVSSANVHGQQAAESAQAAADQLGESCSLYLDDGPASSPAPSTIVDLTGAQARVLREGRISVTQLNEAVPDLIEVAPEPAPEPEPPSESDSTQTDSTQTDFTQTDSTQTDSTETGSTEPRPTTQTVEDESSARPGDAEG